MFSLHTLAYMCVGNFIDIEYFNYLLTSRTFVLASIYTLPRVGFYIVINFVPT